MATNYQDFSFDDYFLSFKTKQKLSKSFSNRDQRALSSINENPVQQLTTYEPPVLMGNLNDDHYRTTLRPRQSIENADINIYDFKVSPSVNTFIRSFKDLNNI